MKVFKRVINIVLDVLLLLILGISTVVVIASVNRQNDAYPNAFGYCFDSVQTPSMEPTIDEGDLIISKLVDDDYEPTVGDIITFKSIIQGQFATKTHRIDSIKENGEIVTKGDNNDSADSATITKSDIIAVYSTRLRGIGKVIDFLKEPLGFILCIVLPILAYIVYQVIYLIKLYVAKRQEAIVESAKDSTSDEVKNAIIQEYLNNLKGKDGENNGNNNKQ